MAKKDSGMMGKQEYADEMICELADQVHRTGDISGTVVRHIRFFELEPVKHRDLVRIIGSVSEVKPDFIGDKVISGIAELLRLNKDLDFSLLNLKVLQACTAVLHNVSKRYHGELISDAAPYLIDYFFHSDEIVQKRAREAFLTWIHNMATVSNLFKLASIIRGN